MPYHTHRSQIKEVAWSYPICFSRAIGTSGIYCPNPNNSNSCACYWGIDKSENGVVIIHLVPPGGVDLKHLWSISACGQKHPLLSYVWTAFPRLLLHCFAVSLVWVMQTSRLLVRMDIVAVLQNSITCVNYSP